MKTYFTNRLSLAAALFLMGSLTLPLAAQSAAVEGSPLVDRKALAKSNQDLLKLEGAAPVVASMDADVGAFKEAFGRQDTAQARALAGKLKSMEALPSYELYRDYVQARLAAMDTLIRQSVTAKPSGDTAPSKNPGETTATRGADPNTQKWIGYEASLAELRIRQQEKLYQELGVITELPGGKARLSAEMLDTLRKRSFALRIKLATIEGTIALLKQADAILDEQSLTLSGSGLDPDQELERAFRELDSN